MPEAKTGVSLASLLRRPNLSYSDIAPLDKTGGGKTGGRFICLTSETDEPSPCLAAVREQAEISIKYDGYIKRQQRQLEELNRMEDHLIPEDIDYNSLQGLRIEARQKLSAVRPICLGQATRISGVSPADAAALMMYLKGKKGDGSLS